MGLVVDDVGGADFEPLGVRVQIAGGGSGLVVVGLVSVVAMAV